MQRLKRLLSRITGVSTPLGGISWDPGSPSHTVHTFSDVICITSAGNDEFISFLKSNSGSIVFLKTHIDACVATEENHQVVEREGLDIDSIASASFSGVSLPLPNDAGELISVVFHFSEGHPLHCSSGGTGVLMVGVTGFFEISQTSHGGPSTVFLVQDFDAPLEFRVSFVNTHCRTE